MASLRRLALLAGALTIVACTRKGSGGTDQPAVQPGLTVSALAVTVARDGSRFRRLAPGDSGIDFINSLEPENSKKYIYNGSGVAIGDYDGDGSNTRRGPVPYGGTVARGATRRALRRLSW